MTPDDARGFVRAKSTSVTGYTLLNLRRVDEYPYAIRHDELPLAGRPAIVVGAGPSLGLNGELLLEAQKRGAAILCVNASAPILTALGVTPDVMLIRESLDTSDQVEASDARLVVMDISVHPLTWSACKDREARWYMPLYPRHGVWYRRLGVRPLKTGTAALTAAAAHALQWGASEVILAGCDLAFAGEHVYHPDAPRGDERIESLGPEAVRFSGRERDRARCERSGQPVGPDELTVTRCIAADFSGYMKTLHTWENQRVWFQQTSHRHPRVAFTNATEGGGGIVGWERQTLAEVVARLPDSPLMELPEGIEIHSSIKDQIVDDLRRECAVYESRSREMQEPHGPDLRHLPMAGLETREGYRPRFGWLEGPLLTPVLAAAPLLAEGLFDENPATIERLKRCYAIHQDAARRASELLA